jgi:CRP/FNR family cyclic AMP-dependent transcriptional regulator
MFAAPDHAPSDFDRLPEPMRELATRGVLRRYRKHAILIEEGSQGDTLHVILKGRVKACSFDDRDREVIYGVYGAGDYVGEMSLDGGPRSASVIALEATTCAILTRTTLQTHIAAHPEFAFELLARVIRRARLATESARSMALLDVYGRIVQLLRSLATPEPDGTLWIAERPTHADMAARIGSSREMVSRLLKDLERGGYISRQQEGLRILKRMPSRW